MNKRLLLIGLLLFVCVSIFAFGGREETPSPNESRIIMLGDREEALPQQDGQNVTAEPRHVRVTGLVRLVGTSNFPEIIIQGADGQWHISGDEMEKLHRLQHRTVTVEADETVIEMRFASGISAGTRRVLKNIQIISVEE